MEAFVFRYKDVEGPKVLIAIPYGAYGGVGTYLYNLLSALDITKINCDIYLAGGEGVEYLRKKLDYMGKGKNINIYMGGCSFYNPICVARNLTDLLKNGEYTAIHSNTGDAIFNGICMFLGYFFSVKTRIAHSHNSSYQKSLVLWKRLLQPVLIGIFRFICIHFATHYFACSKSAGEWLFGKKVFEKKGHIQKNGIDIEKFSYRNEVREDVRRKWGVPNETFVLGHVSNFSHQKNCGFLIDIFYEFQKLCGNFGKDAALVLVGKGGEEQNLRNKILGLNLKNVMFLGHINEPSDYYSAFDAFVMPSLYEGLPFVGIEAQVSSCPCFFSDAITKELAITDNVVFLPHSSTAPEWAVSIYEELSQCLQNERRLSLSVKAKKKIHDAGYDLSSCMNSVINTYMDSL